MAILRSLSIGVLFLGLSGPVFGADALVYRGPGACDEGCSEAAALMATKAGLHPVYVGPDERDLRVFDHAVVWIQPGGQSSQVAQSMREALKERIREFVRSGGGYVGFCAGGFFATEQVGDRPVKGLGILPGRSALYEQVPDEATLIPIAWAGASRQVYWEGGPFFEVSDGTEVMATYPDGSAASVRSRFGAGRVYVTGLHPEAPQSWRDYFKLHDLDGLDHDLAVSMIRWARR